MTARKISARRLSDFEGPRRSKPRLNEQKRELKMLLSRELSLIDRMMEDASIRHALERGMGLISEPMSVWLDSDHSWPLTSVAPNHLPHWEELTEFMKLFIGWDAGMEFGTAYPFTAHIAPPLVTRWNASNTGLVANIEQRLRRALKITGVSELAFGYIVETRSRSGRSRTRPHLHGYLLADEPGTATLFKVALEHALNPLLIRHGRKREIEVQPAHREREGFRQRDRWVSYITKSVDRFDEQLRRRRVYVSRSLTVIVRDSWAIRRLDPKA